MPKARIWNESTSSWVILDAQNAERAINADDADKLGGQEPSYYAAASSVSSLNTNFTNHKTDPDGHDLATTSDNGFMSTTHVSKLNSIVSGATKVEESSLKGNIILNDEELNIYSHPSTHNPSIIDQNEDNRFVTDAQISTWNDKQESLGFTPENTSNKGIAGGYASLNDEGLVPVSQLPSDIKESRIVSTLTDRDEITDLYTGLRVYVSDATDDPTVDSGGAEYIYDATDDDQDPVWIKISESESMDLVLKWSDIQNKPSSTVAEIDHAVDDSHTHSNKSILDETTASFTTTLSDKLSGIATNATKTEESSTNGNILVDEVEVQVYRHPATHTASEISDLDTAVEAIKVDNATNADYATNAGQLNGFKLFIQSSEPNAVDVENGTIWIDAAIT